MKNTPDYILDQALEKLTLSKSVEDAFAQPNPNLTEITELLKLAQTLKAITLPPAPRPVKKYLFQHQQTFLQSLTQFFTTSRQRLALVPIILIAIFFGGSSAIQATANSLPGDTLYSLKIISETARLNFTFNEEKIANIHLELSQRRLDEARRVFVSNDPKQEVAALDALTKQSDKTFAVVSQIAVNKALEGNDSTLLNNLVAINKEQKSVLQNISLSGENKKLTETALTNTKENSQNLARLVAAANEQALLALPNKISSTGIVNNVSTTKLTVDKQVFMIDENTIVTDTNGEVLSNQIIAGKVTVIGVKTNNDIIAKRIILEKPTIASTQPEVKGVVTAKTEIKTGSKTTTTDQHQDTSPQKPSEATAGFIVEPADQQYTP